MYSVGNFFSSVTKFYNEINPATLSGAIDIIVVQQPNGDLACSPFHVRFGKLSVLRPQEKVVEVRVNGQAISFPMKVGDAGEAFFVFETDDYVPEEFATSPIAGPSDDSELTAVDYFDLNGQPQGRPGQHGRRANGGRYINESEFNEDELYPVGEDALLDNGYVSAASGHGSEFEESLRDDSDHESIFSVSSPTQDTLLDMPGSFIEPQPPTQQIPTPVSSGPETSTDQPMPKSATVTQHLIESENGIRLPVDQVFPAVVREELSNGSSESTLPAPIGADGRSGRRPSEVLFDMTGYKTDSGSESSDDDDLPRGVLSDGERHLRVVRKRFSKRFAANTKEDRRKLLEDIKQGRPLKLEDDLSEAQLRDQVSRPPRRRKRAGIPSGFTGQMGRKRANSMPSIGEPDLPLQSFNRLPNFQPGSTQAKKPLSPSDMVPKRAMRPSVMSDTEMEYEASEPPASTQGKGWTWGWGTLPVKEANLDEEDDIKEVSHPPLSPELPEEIETQEFQAGSNSCQVALSLCGDDEFGKDRVLSHQEFNKSRLSFEAFSKDPAVILADKRLVCYINGRFYSWASAAPQLVSLLFYQQPLADPGLDLKDQKTVAGEERPSSTRFGTISRWFRKSPAGATSPPTTPGLTTVLDPMSAGNDKQEGDVAEDGEGAEPAVNKAVRSKSLPPMETGHVDGHSHDPIPSEQVPPGQPIVKRYAKTLRLTSEQLKSLGLKKGANTVSFSVTSSYQGVATCVAKIFLWDHDAQVVISDIDGTITKSDALGHIFAMAGRDWTHLGVAKLFTDIRSNGYHILYLTSRAIGQADYTRKYLQKVEQNSYQLPDGPVIMSPDRLFSAFHREVIIRKPEVFKMACLRDVKKLFGEKTPFYAGFGNRITDALSYRSVNVPPSRIFTIDSYGEVKLELLSAFKSSYLALNDLVNEIFPGQRAAPEFNDWNFWKSEFPKVDFPELPIPANNYNTNGSSTSLLSSTTSVAKKVVSLPMSR